MARLYFTINELAGGIRRKKKRVRRLLHCRVVRRVIVKEASLTDHPDILIRYTKLREDLM